MARGDRPTYRFADKFPQIDDESAPSLEDPVHVHDLHATILHLLGFDHQRLTYRYSGRDMSLTDNHGRVVHEIIS